MTENKTIKEKDFIEIEYTGRTKDEGLVFDTTSKEDAEEGEIYNDKAEYKPVVICVGEGQLIQGLDKQLVGKQVGAEEQFEVPPEEGFGKRQAKDIQLVSTKKFLSQGIQPVPGLQVNVDNQMGVIKTVTGGRTLVDFNHPLSGKDLLYEVKINRILDDPKVKAESYLKLMLGDMVKAEYSEGKLVLDSSGKLGTEVITKLGEKLRELIPEIKEVTGKEEKKEDAKGTAKRQPSAGNTGTEGSGQAKAKKEAEETAPRGAFGEKSQR